MFFIIGTGRCGTTMFAQVLNSHSRICVPPELQILFEHDRNGERLHEVFSSRQNENYTASDFIKLIEQRCPHRFDLYFDYKTFFEKQKYPILNLASLVHDLYHDIALTKGKTLFAEQTPWYGQRLDIMSDLFPDAKFIHMIRDGRDVALSFVRTPWWHDSPNKNLEHWVYEVSKISDDAAQLLHKSQYLEVKYEDFVLDPKTHLTYVLDFLGISFEDEMLLPSNLIDYSIYRKTNMSSHMSKEFNKWNLQKNKVVFADNVFGWKQSGSELFNDLSGRARATLRRFGYEA